MSNGEIKVGQEYVDSMTPKDVLQYMAKMGSKISNYAKQAEAMLAEAEEKGIPVDLSSNEVLQKFKPLGEYEKQLVNLNAEALSISSDLFSQGVKMTHEEVRDRIKKMGL